MASENVSLRKQISILEKVKIDMEQDNQKKSIERMQDLRTNEQKLKSKCKKLNKEKLEMQDAVKEAKNQSSQQESYYQQVFQDL